VKIKGRGPKWRAKLTEAARHHLELGEYPLGHFGPEPVVDLTVDSPAVKCRRGERPDGNVAFQGDLASLPLEIFDSGMACQREGTSWLAMPVVRKWATTQVTETMSLETTERFTHLQLLRAFVDEVGEP
jgi:hypothetical protein